MKRFMKEQYYGQFFGEQALPVLESLRKGEQLINEYKSK